MKSAETVLCALAEAMSADQRILLVGNSFDLLLALAAQPVKELTLISDDADPDAPAGLTDQGAPLRMKREWKERLNSKDLIIDPAGVAPPDEVLRILKKQGIYITVSENDVIDSLPYKRAFQTFAGLACASVPDAENFKHFGALEGKGPIIQMASKSPIPEWPAFGCITPDCDSIAVSLDEIEAKLADQKAQYSALKDERDALRTAYESEQKRAQELQKALEAERTEIAESRKKVEESREQMADYDAIRQELAERRVDDKRYERLAERSEQIKQSLTKELETLRAEWQQTAAPGEEIHQLERDRQALLEAGNHVLDEYYHVMTLFTAWPKTSIPPTLNEPAALKPWLENAKATCIQAKAEFDKNLLNHQVTVQKLAQSEQQLREMKAALHVLSLEQKEREEPKLVIAPLPEETEARIRALQTALESERQLRQQETERFERFEAEAKAALLERDERNAKLHEARRDAARASLEKAALEDEIRRLRLELESRDRHIGDLNEMLEGHARMLALMTETLQEASDAREDAETGRRLADENLRILGQEIERLKSSNS